MRSAAGGALALPLLESLVASEARATSAPYPKRLVILFTPNGTIPENFFGSGDEATFRPGSILEPLVDAGHENDLLVLDHIDESAACQSYGDAHGAGIGCLLTGKKLQPGETFGAGMGGPGSGWPDNESLDQLVARTIGANTELASLELAGKRAPGSIWTRMSYEGPANPVLPEADPQRAFDRIFASAGAPSEPAARDAARRRSILDDSLRELAALNTRIGAGDRVKLEAHGAMLRDLESRISKLPRSSTRFAVPARPTVSGSAEILKNRKGMEVIDADADRSFPQIVEAQLDNIVAALACDVTRVASLLFCPSRSDVVMSWLGFTESHHQVSHYDDAEKDSKAKLTRMNQWYAERIAGFITKLKAIPEGAGTLFSNTLVVWVNELGVGNTHSHTRLPFMIAGSAGGYFRTGRYVRFANGTPHNDLCVSIANAMGIELPNGNVFGDPTYCTGPLSGLTA